VPMESASGDIKPSEVHQNSDMIYSLGPQNKA
jgi:hypothetical protein